eukprot:gene13156-biopygen3077
MGASPVGKAGSATRARCPQRFPRGALQRAHSGLERERIQRSPAGWGVSGRRATLDLLDLGASEHDAAALTGVPQGSASAQTRTCSRARERDNATACRCTALYRGADAWHSSERPTLTRHRETPLPLVRSLAARVLAQPVPRFSSSRGVRVRRLARWGASRVARAQPKGARMEAHPQPSSAGEREKRTRTVSAPGVAEAHSGRPIRGTDGKLGRRYGGGAERGPSPVRSPAVGFKHRQDARSFNLMIVTTIGHNGKRGSECRRPPSSATRPRVAHATIAAVMCTRPSPRALPPPRRPPGDVPVNS